MKVVGFFYVNCGRPDTEDLARLMLKSVREVIKDAYIVHMTNEHTKPFKVNEVIVRPIRTQGVMESRVDHFWHWPHGDALFLDPDIIVQKDPWDVFKEDFDVALTVRAGGLVVDGVDTAGSMPYNTGVTFTRDTNFWGAVHGAMKDMTYKERGWFGEQVAVALMSKYYRVHELKCDPYNFSPDKLDEDVSDKFMVHYKGPIRKQWMLHKHMETA